MGVEPSRSTMIKMGMIILQGLLLGIAKKFVWNSLQNSICVLFILCKNHDRKFIFDIHCINIRNNEKNFYFQYNVSWRCTINWIVTKNFSNFQYMNSRRNITIRGNMSHPEFGFMIKFCFVIALGSRYLRI